MFSDLATDFCAENHTSLGISVTEKRFGVICERVVTITKESAAKAVGKPCGTYVSLEVPFGTLPEIPLALRIQTAITTMILPNISKGGRVLVVGFGNGNLSCDALGDLTLNRLLVGKGNRVEVLTLKPGVEGVTGVPGAAIVRAVVQQVKPEVLLCLDALVGANYSRIGSVFQLTDTGISPGSGTGVRNYSVTRESLGIPVYALGVPLACSFFTEGESGHQKYLVCPREIDLVVRRVSRVLAEGVNLAFHPELSFRDLYSAIESLY